MARIIFLGQGPLGEACFAELMQSGINVVAAVSNISNDNWWKSNAIFKTCSDAGIDFIDNDARNETALLAAIRHNQADTIISVQHSWIISEEALSLAPRGAFNVHMAKLPEYKGHHPFIHVLLNGETSHTVTIHRMTPKVDVGDIAYEQTFPISPEETARSLYERSRNVGQNLFKRLVSDLKNNVDVPGRPMSGSHRFYSRNSIGGLDQIKDSGDFLSFDRKVRAFFFPPFPPAHFFKNGKKYYITPAEDLHRN